MSLDVKVGLIGKFDMLKFKNMSKVREKEIQKASSKEISAKFAINENAKQLHPDYQELIVDQIVEHKDAQSKVFVLKSSDNKPLPYFRSGQYISLKLPIKDSFVTRAYAMSSSPKDALEGKYEIAIREKKDGFAAEVLLNEVKVGDTLLASDPQGFFYYEELRDAKTIVGLAGGSGITPFLSMARSIRDGIEDFNLILLYGSRNSQNILFRKELDEIEKACPKFKVIHILSESDEEGYEHGFITADLIQKYAPSEEPYSIYLCGPNAMSHFVKPEIEKLNLPKRFVRQKTLEVTKTPWLAEDYPKEHQDKVYKMIVKQGPEEYTIEANANESVLTAIERAGIKAPSNCRSGECGWCRARMLKGTIYSPQENEYRRWSDIEHGYIHTCSSFPTSDLEIEIAGEYY